MLRAADVPRFEAGALGCLGCDGDRRTVVSYSAACQTGCKTLLLEEISWLNNPEWPRAHKRVAQKQAPAVRAGLVYDGH
jgi:hypothetical protein